MERDEFIKCEFVCSKCKHPGIIISACFNACTLILEGLCLSCKMVIGKKYDMLEVSMQLSEADNMLDNIGNQGGVQ